MTPETERAGRAAVARKRWRADLQLMNGDTAQAEMLWALADIEERFNTAKKLAQQFPYDQGLRRVYKDLERQLVAARNTYRARYYAQHINAVDDFDEPSDDELLSAEG